MAAALGGLDALVFTGGVGEHAPRRSRGRAPPGSAFLGVALDDAATTRPAGDADIGAPGAGRARSWSRPARTSRSRAPVRAVLG